MSNYQVLVDVVIKAEVAGAPRHELVLEVCAHPPAALLQAGVPDLPIVIRAKTLGKIFFEHGITQSQIAKLEQLLATCSAVYKSESRPTDSVVVVTVHQHGGAPVIVPIEMNVPQGYARVNRVTSMYGKTGPDKEPRWVAAGLKLY